MHTLTVLGNIGGLQVRVNGIVVSREELLALDLGAVERIELIDSPGVCYGLGQLTYSLSDSSYVLQARLSASSTLRPLSRVATYHVASNDAPATYTDRSSSRNTSPTFDLYYLSCIFVLTLSTTPA